VSWIDGFGRTAGKLRVSVTDRCDLRCLYCMPAKPVWMPREGILSYEELTRVSKIAASEGVKTVRVTGGEPLVRAELERFIAMLKDTQGIDDVALTTNGTRLAKMAYVLRDAGLDRLTVSLDSIDTEVYAKLTRRGGPDAVMRGLSAAEDAGFSPKINCVVMRGINDGEVARLAAWARDTGRTIRFIEFMPLEGDRIWGKDLLVPASEIVQRVNDSLPCEDAGRKPGATAADYRFLDGKGTFSVIASVTQAFCADCDRIRLTADGTFKTCLFQEGGTDLKTPLRQGASDSDLSSLMASAVAGKGAGHMIGQVGFTRPERAMNAIGG